MDSRSLPGAGPDQMAAAGSYTAEQWGDHGVQVSLYGGLYGGRGYAVFQVDFSDGGHQWFIVDPHCNIEMILDGEDVMTGARDRLEARIAAQFASIDEAGKFFVDSPPCADQSLAPSLVDELRRSMAFDGHLVVPNSKGAT